MTIATINPTSGQVEASFPSHDAGQIERRLASAAAAHATLRRCSYRQRSTWMRAAADLLEGDAETLAHTLTREMGEPLAQARAEAMKCARTMRYYAEHAEAFPRRSAARRSGGGGCLARVHALPAAGGRCSRSCPGTSLFWQALRVRLPGAYGGQRRIG